MRRLRTHHPNRAGLHVVDTGDPDRAPGHDTQTPNAGTAADCRCPTRTVAGTRWAYDRQLGWHDPDEHAEWTPPYWPTH